MKKLFEGITYSIKDRFLDDDIPIQTKLSNLIMVCAAAGCAIALIFSAFINNDPWAILMITAAFLTISMCLYISAWARKPKYAAFLVVFMIDELIFPFMYIACGGIHSGMICWLIVGLIFPFLVLSGWISWAIFGLGAATFSICYIGEYLNWFKVVPLTGFGWFEDAYQSMVLVSLLFGVIFKFQNHLYTKQNDELRKREEDIQKALLELERANKAKSDFLANMSHEIRTPINAIMGMNEIILRECKEENVVQNSMNIQTASDNLLSLVNDILDFSKIESGKMEIIDVDYELSSLLNDCYNLIFMRAANKNLEFRVVNDPHAAEFLHGDETHIRQVIINLLTNAVKYTKEGFVELNVKFEQIDEVNANFCFAVSDSGVGIPAEDMDKLFISFERIDEVHNRNIEGTGLGLSIAKTLVEQMNGKFYVESEVGKGSTFSVVIPQKITKEGEIGEFSKRYEEYQKKRGTEYKEKLHAPDARILVVDDVKVNLTVVKGLLKPTEIKIDTALNGKDALKYTDENKYDIIFLDHMMPDMDGIQTFHFIKARKNINEETPVIVLTANAIKGAEEGYRAEGFNDYLAKPVHGDELENMLLKYLPKDKIK